jgi:carboxylesterase
MKVSINMNDDLYRFRNRKNIGLASKKDIELTASIDHTNKHVNNRTGILLIHGFSSNPFSMHMLSQVAKESAYRTIVPLLPGHAAGVEAMESVSFLDWLQEVQMEYLKLRESCDKVVVIGQSLGGVLGSLIDFKFKNVDQLILLVPAFYPTRLLKLVRYVKPVLNFFGVRYLKTIAGSVKREKQYELCYGKVHLNFFVQLNQVCRIGHKSLEYITAPVYFVGSSGDSVISERTIKKAYKLCGSAEKKYISLKNSDHLVSLDNDIEIIKNLLLSTI